MASSIQEKFTKPLSSFTSILGLTPNEALAVARNDGWFETNKNNDVKTVSKITL